MGLIAGILYFNNDANVSSISLILNKMLKVQKHRGNGEAKTYSRNTVALGMVNSQDNIFVMDSFRKGPSYENDTTLKGIHAFVDGVVLDVPMHIKTFEHLGYPVSNACCSTVVELAYKHWGMDFMNYLEGEFSCTIWDENRKTLILVRDPYGHKPLHYYIDSKKIIFASEIKGILVADFSAEIDLISLSDFLSLNCIPCPGTIFKGIKQVPPGNIIIISNGSVKNNSYWYPKITEEDSLSLNDASKLLADALRSSVKKRMIKKNTYCFLSGGIDSSAVLSFAAELSNRPIQAITVGFDEEEVNELEYAKTMARHVGAEHHYMIAKPDSFYEMLDFLVYHHDSPFTDTSAYPTYYAAKLARQFTDIILTGDGPDQTMGGSAHHVSAIKKNLFSEKSDFQKLINKFTERFLRMVVKDPAPTLLYKIRRKLYRDSLTSVTAIYDHRSSFPSIVKSFLCEDSVWDVHRRFSPYRHPESWFKEAGDVDNINKYLFAEIKFYSTDDLMIKVDRMCMAHGLETLSPFQDIYLGEIINKLPINFKINKSPDNKITTKYLLREICKEKFPDNILTKQKQGFGIPIEKWLRHKNCFYLKEVLLDSKSLKRGFFKEAALKKFVFDFINNKGDYFYPSAYGLVGLLTLELWHRKYIDKNLAADL